MEQRYEAADKPVCSLGFQPHVQNSWDVFVDGKNDLNIKLVDELLLDIFKKYKLTPENNTGKYIRKNTVIYEIINEG